MSSVFTQRLHNDPFEFCRSVRRKPGQRRSFFLGYRYYDVSRGFASNGVLPAIISYITTPRLQMSLRASTALPRACSGDILGGNKVPAFIYADFVNGKYVWMIKGRGGAGFLFKTIQSVSIRSVQL